MKRILLLAVVLAVVAVACGDDDTTDATTAETTAATSAAETTAAPSAAGAAITIEGFDFGEPITVAVGTTVTVTNNDGATHTWTASNGAFDSGNLNGGDSFEFTFAEAGTFEFFCKIHPSMTGSITVTG